MEQSLYAQIIKFRQKDLKFDAADKNKNESKFKFQGQSGNIFELYQKFKYISGCFYHKM